MPAASADSVARLLVDQFYKDPSLENDKYADLTIFHKGRYQTQCKAHKLVLCTQSEFFDKMCSGGSKVSLRALASHLPHHLLNLDRKLERIRSP